MSNRRHASTLGLASGANMELRQKQIRIYGQPFEVCSLDGGRTWDSSPRSLVQAARRRQEQFRRQKLDRYQLSTVLNFGGHPGEAVSPMTWKNPNYHVTRTGEEMP